MKWRYWLFFAVPVALLRHFSDAQREPRPTNAPLAVTDIPGPHVSATPATTAVRPSQGDIDAQWALGQAGLAEFVGARAYLVHSDQFRLKKRSGPFTCGSTKNAWGCFWAPQAVIEWYDVRILEHESKHAILWKLGDRRWRCVDHEPDCLSR